MSDQAKVAAEEWFRSLEEEGIPLGRGVEHLAAIIAKHFATPAQPAPAEGDWVLVPREPTPEMIAAGQMMLPDDMPTADAVYKMMVEYCATAERPAAQGERAGLTAEEQKTILLCRGRTEQDSAYESKVSAMVDRRDLLAIIDRHIPGAKP